MYVRGTHFLQITQDLPIHLFPQIKQARGTQKRKGSGGLGCGLQGEPWAFLDAKCSVTQKYLKIIFKPFYVGYDIQQVFKNHYNCKKTQ